MRPFVSYSLRHTFFTPTRRLRLRRISDEAFADLQKENLGIVTRFLHYSRIVPVFECRFLKHKFHRILRFISLGYEDPGTPCEGGVSFRFYLRLRRRNLHLSLAFVLAKLHSG